MLPRGRSHSSRYISLALCCLLALAPLGACATPPRRVEAPPATSPPAATPSSAATAPVPASPQPSEAPSVSVQATASAPATAPVVFAAIGDYGTGGASAARVASLVRGWRPSYIIAMGDCYYHTAGGSGEDRYVRSTARFYRRWIAGAAAGSGEASRNAFFPSLGNHDYSDARPGPRTYLDYFDLPGRGFRNSSGNERYYDFVEGPVHFFVVNSNEGEPDGVGRDSRQARWLRTELSRSTSRWNVVYFHHPPFSSDTNHGSTGYMRWPFAEWGADVVLSGHAHTYERVMRDGIVYFVNGLGGQRRYAFDGTVEGSAVHYAKQWGAQRVTVTDEQMVFEFRNSFGQLIDRYVLRHR